MPRPKSIKKNLVYAVIGQGVEKAVSLFVIAVLAHNFSQFEMGQFFLAISITTIAGYFTEIGTSTHLVRAISGKPDSASLRLSEVLFLRIPLISLAVASICGYVLIVDPSQLLLYATVSLYVLGQSAYFSLASVFVGLQSVFNRVCTSLVGPGVLLLIVPVGVWSGISFERVLMVYAASSIIMLAVTAISLSNYINLTVSFPTRSALLTVVKSTLPIFALMILILIHSRIDEIMLAVFRDFEEVAIYAAGYKLLEVSRMAVRPVTMVLFPLLAAAAASEVWRQFGGLVSKMVWGSLALGTFVALCAIPLASSLVPLAFGDAYEQSITVAQILFLSAPAVFLGHTLILIANAMKVVKSAIIVLSGSVIANALLNAVVIPNYGAIGAAWTTLITESTAAAGVFICVHRVIRRKKSSIEKSSA